MTIGDALFLPLLLLSIGAAAALVIWAGRDK